MTKITLKRNNKRYIGFCISGHSGYDESGRDIICAGISVLSINFINSVDSFTDDKYSLDTDEENGFMDFIFKGSTSKESRLLLDSLILGLTELQKENKDFISLDYKEV